MNWQDTIKELRETLTVIQIATRVGVSVQAIYQIGHGTIKPAQLTGDALKRLLKREQAVKKTRKRIDEREARA